MNGKYVQCTPKKKWKKMGLHSLYLHKVLIHQEKTGKSVNVDHRDGNENNYQKDNLRVCTHQQNMWNRKLQGGTSKYKGVSWNSESRVWRAQIRTEKTCRLLGRFRCELL
jgi:hypothetical protein